MNILLIGRDKFEIEANLSTCQKCFGLEPIYQHALNFDQAQHSILSNQTHFIIMGAASLQFAQNQPNNLLIAIQLKNFSSESHPTTFKQNSTSEIIYLQREFSTEEILRALIKVYGDAQLLKVDSSAKARITIPIKGGFKFIKLNEILRLEGSGSYTIFYLISGKKITASKRIGSYTKTLPLNHFLRVHQSHIINIKMVEELIKAGEYYVLLKGKEKIPVAKQRLAHIENVLFNAFRVV